MGKIPGDKVLRIDDRIVGCDDKRRRTNEQQARDRVSDSPPAKKFEEKIKNGRNRRKLRQEICLAAKATVFGGNVSRFVFASAFRATPRDQLFFCSAGFIFVFR